MSFGTGRSGLEPVRSGCKVKNGEGHLRSLGRRRTIVGCCVSGRGDGLETERKEEKKTPVGEAALRFVDENVREKRGCVGVLIPLLLPLLRGFSK